MNKLWALFLTIITGIFFLLGVLIAKKNNKKERLRAFANSLALVVMVGLVIFDLIPEIFNIFKESNVILSFITVICFILIGFVCLKILDGFVPAHHHQHKSNEKNQKEHDNHLVHIGLITAISLILHNFIEGMSLYATILTGFKAGLIMCISIALHNIPLGIEIALSLEKRTSKFLSITLFTILAFSPLLGTIAIVLIGNINEFILGCIISLTIGLILYIIICELLKEYIVYKANKESKLGLCIGIIIIGISLLI